MKTIIVLIAIVGLVRCDVWKPPTEEEYKKVVADCVESEKIPKESFEAIKVGTFPAQPGCFFRCEGLKLGMWDDVNGYDVNRSNELLTKNGWETSVENLKLCNIDKTKDSDPCVWSSNVVKCLWDGKLLVKKPKV